MRGSILLTAGEVLVYGSSFVRNMILARLLTKADFGVAATFSMVILLLEFSGKLGISRFVIRDKDGGAPEFIAAAHLIQFAAGVFSSLVIAAAAWPLAGLFGIGNQWWAMLVLAILPLLIGLNHLDVRRFERDLRFGPSTLVEVIPQIFITLAAWPVAMWLGDYRAMLLLLVAKSAMTLVSTHFWAEQRYRWRFHREYVGRMLRFGWPLVVTGFLMFGVLHGDQFLVATFYSMSDLGPYAAAAALTMAPTFFFGRVFNSMMLPLMAKVQDAPVAFQRRYNQALAVISTFSGVCAVGMIVGAEALMTFVYGVKYAGAGIILACLATSNVFRNIRIGPSLAALAQGDSKNQMISNLWRVTALLPALMIAAAGQPVWIVATTGLLGEMLACGAALFRLRNRNQIPLSVSLIPMARVGVITVTALLAWNLGVRYWNPWIGIGVASLGAVAAGLALVATTPILRQEVRIIWLRICRARMRGSTVKVRP